MRILFTGGGTLGPVAPLLAIAEALRAQGNVEILGLVGTKNGPERELAEQNGLKFYSISAGKLRRYFDLRNLWALFEAKIGFFQSLFLLRRLRPSVVVSGGSFVGVPVIWAAWFLRIPTVTHQQDVRRSLANRLVAPIVSMTTVVFPHSSVLQNTRMVVTGNPVRTAILKGDAERAREKFGLEPDLPTLLVFGGGTGAQAINEIVTASLTELTKFCQLIHITGKGKLLTTHYSLPTRYHPIELLTDEMADAYAVADLVVARAGVGTITELSALAKPAIIIPIPGSHQEENAALLASHGAALVLDQKKLTPEKFTETIRDLITDSKSCQKLSEEIKKLNLLHALDQIISIIASVAKQSK